MLLAVASAAAKRARTLGALSLAYVAQLQCDGKASTGETRAALGALHNHLTGTGATVTPMKCAAR
ncbi:MAG: hypothetical protein JSS41_04260 [Proteobacteria bacterium]|nr:hypothetical protein [Pseudomonadota bacterium]